MQKLILFVLLAGCLHAQAPISAAGTPVSVTFKTVGLGVALDDIVIKLSKGYVPLVIASNAVSVKACAYTGPAAMPVFRKVKSAEKISYEPVGQVDFPLPESGRVGRFLLLFMQGNDGRLMINPVPNDAVSFPAKTIRVINVLPAPAGIMVNKDTDVLKPGQNRLFSTATAKNNRVEIHIAVQHRDKWTEVNNDVFSCGQDSRLTLFIVNRTPPNTPATQLPSVGFISMTDSVTENTTAEETVQTDQPSA